MDKILVSDSFKPITDAPIGEQKDHTPVRQIDHEDDCRYRIPGPAKAFDARRNVS